MSKSENLQKLALMMEMQSKLNAVINPQWKLAGYNWNRAIIDEGAELMGHYGWKWWKKFNPDIPQCRLELIDILHFLLSKMCLSMTPEMAYDYLNANGLFESTGIESDPETVRKRIDGLIHEASRDCEDQSDMGDLGFHFSILCHSLGLKFEEMFGVYVRKNALNLFRQANGYKEGTYKKIYADGREDNEHLEEICQGVDFTAADALVVLSQKLTDRYAQK